MRRTDSSNATKFSATGFRASLGSMFSGSRSDGQSLAGIFEQDYMDGDFDDDRDDDGSEEPLFDDDTTSDEFSAQGAAFADDGLVSVVVAPLISNAFAPVSSDAKSSRVISDFFQGAPTAAPNGGDSKGLYRASSITPFSEN